MNYTSECTRVPHGEIWFHVAPALILAITSRLWIVQVQRRGPGCTGWGDLTGDSTRGSFLPLEFKPQQRRWVPQRENSWPWLPSSRRSAVRMVNSGSHFRSYFRSYSVLFITFGYFCSRSISFRLHFDHIRSYFHLRSHSVTFFAFDHIQSHSVTVFGQKRTDGSWLTVNLFLGGWISDGIFSRYAATPIPDAHLGNFW